MLFLKEPTKQTCYTLSLFMGKYHRHREIIFQSGYNSGHIANPFSPLFSPHRSEYPTPFHLMWPRNNNQIIWDPVCERICIFLKYFHIRFYRKTLKFFQYSRTIISRHLRSYEISSQFIVVNERKERMREGYEV